jgi:NAD kinase
VAARTARTRMVLVTRHTEYEDLLARHATRAQASFFLESRGQTLEPVELRHHAFQETLKAVLAVIPVDWRRTRLDRFDLDRFLFEPDDIVVALGRDGLVANMAKYLNGQLVIGLNPDPGQNEGVLVPHPPAAAADLLADAAAGRGAVEERSMVEANLDDGQRLLALNELYLGQRTHQSSRYDIRYRDQQENHSSSGIIISTGTGSTGWARSIQRERGAAFGLPRPADPQLAFFVREAWPSVATGTSLTQGLIESGERLEIVSRMDAGVVFGDGIEEDTLELGWGRRVTLGLAETRLRMIARPG